MNNPIPKSRLSAMTQSSSARISWGGVGPSWPITCSFPRADSSLPLPAVVPAWSRGMDNTHRAACFEDGRAHIAQESPGGESLVLRKFLTAHRHLAVWLVVRRENRGLLVDKAQSFPAAMNLGVCPCRPLSLLWHILRGRTRESEAQLGALTHGSSPSYLGG
jgi:hypothetical protein